MPDHRDVRPAGAGGRGAGQQRERAAVPGAAQHRRQRGDFPGSGLQRRGELGLDHQQPLVCGRGVGGGGVADRPDQALPRGQAGGDASWEGRVRAGDQAPDVVPGGSLACLGGVTDEHEELVGVMARRLDLKVGATSDGGTERDQ